MKTMPDRYFPHYGNCQHAPDRERPGLDNSDVSIAPCGVPVGGDDGRGARSPPGDESTRRRCEGGDVTSWFPRLGVRRVAKN